VLSLFAFLRGTRTGNQACVANVLNCVVAGLASTAVFGLAAILSQGKNSDLFRSEGYLRPAILFPALSAAALFAVSPGVWEYATHAEVFALNNFLCACLLSVLVLFLGSIDRSALEYRNKKDAVRCRFRLSKISDFRTIGLAACGMFCHLPSYLPSSGG